MNLETVEIKKTKIEMLEKEANLIFKQIVFFITVGGAIISFLIHNISFNLNLGKSISISDFILLLIDICLVIIFIGKLTNWLFVKINRLNQLNEKIGDLND